MLPDTRIFSTRQNQSEEITFRLFQAPHRMMAVNIPQYALNMYNPIGVMPKVIPGSTNPVATGADVAGDLTLAQIRRRQVRRIA